jgi:acetyltransferase-like isoleucine patch superfamily enzyme
VNTASYRDDPRIVIGEKTHIAEDVQFVFLRDSKVTIGDACVIGPGVKFVCNGGDISIDDWTTLHDRCLVLSSKGVEIGQHCWFGQNTVIDGTGGISIGNGVRVGMYSQLWSHVAAGEQIEGCTLFGTRPVRIEDEVWLVGSCIVSSGITVARRTTALIASNLTKSTEPGSVVAGSPAEIKPRLSFYKPLSLNEKWALLCGWLSEIASEQGLEVKQRGQCSLQVQWAGSNRNARDILVFTTSKEDAQVIRGQGVATVCCLEDKSYNKRLSLLEIQVLKALAGNKARFYRTN